jgi:RNA polymerase sigma-70 factor (ECF subfamily)
MAGDSSFEDLMSRLRGGDQAAAREIFERFAQRLIGLARNRLAPAIRQKVDPEDVMLSAMRSFFTRHANGQFDLADWDGLWSLLTVITLRKCGHRVEYFQAARRDVRREARAADPDDSAARWEAVAREPTPAEAAMLTETVEQVLRGVDERDRPIVEMALQGHKAPEISEKLGRSERTVYRLLSRVHARLQRLCTADA